MASDSLIIPVIVVNYNSSELIPDLLKSISEKDVEVKVFVLENGSSDNSWENLQRINDNRLVLFKSETNLGFTGGVNFAVQYVKELYPDTSYFFLLNPDALLIEGILYGLYKMMTDVPLAASISPKIYDLKKRPWYSGAEIDFINGGVHNNPGRKEMPKGSAIEVDVFSGCASLFNMARFTQAGGFSDKLFMYYDEADLSIRIKNLGYKILYTDKFEIYHDVSYTTKHISFVKSYYMTRNKFIVFGKTMPLYKKVYFLLRESAFYGKNLKFINLKYHLKGFVDYMSGKYGVLK